MAGCKPAPPNSSGQRASAAARFRQSGLRRLRADCQCSCTIIGFLVQSCVVQPHCQTCDHPFENADFQVAEGVAVCASCGSVMQLARGEHQALTVHPDRPPPGCMLHYEGSTTVLRASCHAPSATSVLLLIALFWNGGLTTAFVSAFNRTMQHLTGPRSGWQHGIPTSSQPSLWLTVLMWMVLIPFATVGIGVIAALAMTIAGHVEVRLGRDEGSVASGIGPLRRTRRFRITPATLVRLVPAAWDPHDDPSFRVIALHADRTIRFGGLVPKDRRLWLVAAMRRAIAGDSSR